MAPGPTANGHSSGGPSAEESSSSRPWLWPAHAVFSTPSRTHPKDPFAWKREAFDRCIGIHYITRVGMALRQPQLSIATASVYFHRFYMLQPLQDYPWKEMAATALFLAIKVEEVPRKLDQVVREFLIADGHPTTDEMGNLVESSPDFFILRKRILFYEDILLRTLTYDLAVNHPYVPLIRTVRLLHDWRSSSGGENKTPSAHSKTPNSDQNGASPSTAPSGAGTASAREKAKKLSQSAWGFVNDSFSTPLCVIKTPETVAAAAYLLALKYLQEPVPETFQEGAVVPKEAGEAEAHAAKKDEKGKGVDREGEGVKEEQGKEGESVPVATDFATKASKAVPNGKPTKLPQTWWGAFGATSLREVNEAANIMLDHYERSAADYIRSQARAISRPPDPSPIAIDPYSAAQSAAQSRPPTASTGESGRVAPTGTDGQPQPPPPPPPDEKPPLPPSEAPVDAPPPPPPAEAPPKEKEDEAPPRSMYSPKPRKGTRRPAEGEPSPGADRRDPKRPRHDEPAPPPLPPASEAESLNKTAAPFPDPMQIDGVPAGEPLTEQHTHDNRPAQVDGWHPESPSGPLAPAAPPSSTDPPLPDSLTTLHGEGSVDALPLIAPILPAPEPESVKQEGEEMLRKEEEMRLEGGLRKDEERMANHESRGTWIDGAAASGATSPVGPADGKPKPRPAWNGALASYGSSSASGGSIPAP